MNNPAESGIFMKERLREREFAEWKLLGGHKLTDWLSKKDMDNIFLYENSQGSKNTGKWNFQKNWKKKTK